MICCLTWLGSCLPAHERCKVSAACYDACHSEGSGNTSRMKSSLYIDLSCDRSKSHALTIGEAKMKRLVLWHIPHLSLNFPSPCRRVLIRFFQINALVLTSQAPHNSLFCTMYPSSLRAGSQSGARAGYLRTYYLRE